MDLKRSNELMAELCKSDKRFSPISNNDQELFNFFFAKYGTNSYGDSWSYVTQGMYGIGDNLGYKFYDGENLSAVCFYPRLEFEEQLFYWVRPLGRNISEVVSDISHKIKDLFKVRIYVKKIDSNLLNILIDKGFNDISSKPWHSTAIAEDDTYPEIILDAQLTIDNPNKSTRIENAMRQFNKLENTIRVTKIVKKEDRDKAWNVADKFFNQEVRSLDHNISSKYDYYNLIYNPANFNYEMFLIEKDEESVGFFDTYRLSGDTVSSYSALMLREEIGNLNDFSIIYTCRYCISQGLKYINLGGSETIGLNNFKTKFYINDEHKMYWVVLV